MPDAILPGMSGVLWILLGGITRIHDEQLTVLPLEQVRDRDRILAITGKLYRTLQCTEGIRVQFINQTDIVNAVNLCNRLLQYLAY